MPQRVCKWQKVKVNISCLLFLLIGFYTFLNPKQTILGLKQTTETNIPCPYLQSEIGLAGVVTVPYYSG